MGSIKGVTINKGIVGPNASGPDTSPSAFMFNGPALSTLLVNTPYFITTVKQAEALGITADYDITNDVVVHEHIKEIYRMLGEGNELSLMNYSVTPAEALEDTNSLYAKKLVTMSAGKVRQLALAYNVPSGDTETLTDGFSSAIRAAIPKAQLFAEWAYLNDRPCHIILEGRSMSNTLSSTLNLRNILVSSVLLSAPKVTIVAGQDWDYAHSRRISDLEFTATPGNPAPNEYEIVLTWPAVTGATSYTWSTIINDETVSGTTSNGTTATITDLEEETDYLITFSAIVNGVLYSTFLIAGSGGDPVTIKSSKTKNYAAVGTFLGTLASAEINQSTAEVAVFNLSDAKKAKWLTGGLSNHNKIAEVESDLQSLDDKGYVFGLTYNTNAISGYRWNNDHVCCPIIIDEDGNYNEHMIYFGRTMDECSRELRNRLLLRIKSRVSVDTATGKLSVGVRKNLESEGNKGFDKFASRGLIEDGKTFIDENSDLITPPKTLLVSFKVVATPILDNITGKINLVKSIQA